MDSGKDMVEVGIQKMKKKIQALYFEIQEYSFTETQEVGSSDKFKSRSDLYAIHGHEKNVSS